MSEPIHGDKPHEWMALAACQGLPSSWWFPERGVNGLGEDDGIRQARKVCNRCPSQAACLEYAITPPVERSGIYGGMSSRERGQLRGRRVV